MNRWMSKATGRLMAWIYNGLFLSNATFRKLAHQSMAFEIPSYKSFFVRGSHMADPFVEYSFPKELIEVVKVEELHKIAWNVWNRAHEL